MPKGYRHLTYAERCRIGEHHMAGKGGAREFADLLLLARDYGLDPSSALFADNCPIPPISSRQAIDLVDVEFRFSNVVT